jgi:TPR repeat protein
MYLYGQGAISDYGEAAKCNRLAAAQGIASAQASLGVMYANGQGVAQDYVRAHMWLNLSGASGDALGTTNRDIIAARMTPQQIAEAQTMARECQRHSFKGCD